MNYVYLCLCFICILLYIISAFILLLCDPIFNNIKEILGAFTFNLHMMEVIRKRVRIVKQSDGTLEEMQEDEVLFEKTNEDPTTVAITSTTLTQATTPNITILNANILEVE